MATEGSRSASSSADSYIGSLISLTSKSEIRYEGILYNINTEESSIGLRNVRSFGTEGRKKDGPQLMPSDKVYEYILFRGSDIKDLQVKSSMPAQPTQPINGDPAIIQSHYPRPPPLQSSTLPTAANSSVPDPNIQNPQTGQTGPLLQSGPPLYPPGGNLGSWGPMPPHPNPNSTGLPMPPMYWPGFYAPPNGLPQLHQQSLLRPPPMQYPNYNANLPNGPPSMDTLPSLMQNKLPNSVGPNDVNLNIPNKPSGPSDVPPPPYLVTPGELLQSGLTTTGPVSSQSAEMVHKEVKVVQVPPTPYLITPGELVQSGLTMGPVSSQSAETVHKEVEAVQVEPAPESEQSAPVLVPVLTEAQPPILPLPPQQRVAPKTNGAPYQNRQSYNYRGRERGRGCGGPRSVMKFTEEFDFTAMNEKFNKDEIWGSLGKTNKDEEEYEDENDAEVDVKPVYSKDDFFDTLSCNSLDKQSSNGRPRFSEQMKLDTETFGEFSRHRGGRGGRGPNRGGRSRGGGGYYWRGGGGYNNSYGGRGARGGRVSNAAAREY